MNDVHEKANAFHAAVIEVAGEPSNAPMPGLKDALDLIQMAVGDKPLFAPDDLVMCWKIVEYIRHNGGVLPDQFKVSIT